MSNSLQFLTFFIFDRLFLVASQAGVLAWRDKRTREGEKDGVLGEIIGNRPVDRASGATADLRDGAGLDDLYRRFFQPLTGAIRKAFGAGPPEPEDVAQAAFVRYAAMDDASRVRDPQAFLFMTARNIVMDHKRKAKRNDAYVADQLAYDPDFQLEEITPERVLEEKERFEILVAAMQELPRKQQTVLAMSRLQGKTYEQIIKETGWSLGDISRNLNAGKTALREALQRGRMRRTPKR